MGINSKRQKKDKPIQYKNEIVNNVPLRGEMTRNRDKMDVDKYEYFIKERPMMAQTCQNPFLTKDFTDVINDQERFLIPKDSFLEKS